MLIALGAPKLLSTAFWRLIKIEKVKWGLLGSWKARGGKKRKFLGGGKKRDSNS